MKDVLLQKRMQEEAEQKAELARSEAVLEKRLAEAGERLREAAKREADVKKRSGRRSSSTMTG